MYWVIEGDAVPRLPWFTRANAGETMPDPVTPLGWTLLWDRALLPGWAKGNVSFGCLRAEEVAGDPRCMAAVFGGYFYLNLSAVRMVGVRMPGATVEAIDHGLFGSDPSLPPYVPQDGDESPECTALLTERIGWVLGADRWDELDERHAAAGKARSTRPDLATCTDAELVARARSLDTVCEDLYELHVWTGLSCAVAYGALVAAATERGSAEAVNDLIAGLGDVESAAPVLAMWDLSRLPAPSPEFDAAFRDFLAEHGGRGLGDWDLSSPSWELAPERALLLVDRLRAVGPDAAPRAHGAAAAERREALAADLLAGDDGALRTALRATGFFVRMRERSRGGLIIGMNEIRMPIHELARRCHRRGDLDHAEDLFLLLDAELDGFLADPAAHRVVLEERRTTYRSLFELRPPYFTRDRIRLEDLPPRGTADVAPAPAGTVIQGVSGAARGQVTGRARVLADPYDQRGLAPGDVLIARQTDPTWTPLFVDAAAVVVDFGSPMSHAVIVGRELDTICVVSAENASLRIPDGATVLVDGTAGTVTVL